MGTRVREVVETRRRCLPDVGLSVSVEITTQQACAMPRGGPRLGKWGSRSGLTDAQIASNRGCGFRSGPEMGHTNPGSRNPRIGQETGRFASDGRGDEGLKGVRRVDWIG